VAEASRALDLSPWEIEGWLDDAVPVLAIAVGSSRPGSWPDAATCIWGALAYRFSGDSSNVDVALL